MTITQATCLKENIKNSNLIWQLNDVMDLFAMPFNDLIFKSSTIHRQNFNANEVQVSTLLSIKTGGCPENCSYCPQSAHYETTVKKEDLLSTQTIVAKALEAKEIGASRFCMGAAWRSLNDRDVEKMSEIISSVKDLGLETCVTLGMATEPQLKKLKESGLDFYNHNIDTSEEYYSEIISTRGFEDRINTLHNISNAGLKTCSGGIIGMGEKIEDRAKMLITLSKLPTPPESIPINMLVKVEGTPLENKDDLDPIDFVRTIAVARIMFPTSFVRLSAGREKMSDETQALCFLAGANSIFYGEKLLTTANNGEDRDRTLFDKLGLKKI